MRTALYLAQLAHRPRQKINLQLQCAEALRACEVAAERVKCASDELAARWATLARELAAGAPSTDLLRTRAWCNVLELRLKERASALELARQLLDDVWRAALPDLGPASARPDPLEHPRAVAPADAVWPIFTQATTASATRRAN